MGVMLLTLLTFYLYTVLKYRSAFYMLQQNSYNTSNRYIKWVFKNYRTTLLSVDIIAIPLIIIAGFILKDNFYNFYILLLYAILFYYELKKIKKEQQKKVFVITARIKRLIITTLILYIILTIVIYFNFDNDNMMFYCLYYAILSFLAYLMTYIINIINIPVEKYVYHHFKSLATKKLNNMNDLIKIGITGSYGKTTSKNILNSILESKYNSFATPKSFNTPYGLIMSVNNNLDKFDNAFVAEMGACKIGDIKELCDLIHPKYGIITKIGLAHLETFKTIENTIKTKFELIESLPSDGIGILNADDENQVNYKIKNNCRIIWIGIDNNADVRATNIKLSNQGMSFDVTFKNNKKKISFTTPLLGSFNIYNILAGLALGKELGIDIDDMKKAISSLKATEHRLELRKYNNVTIIDDAYNSNPEGSKMALEVLSLMPGKKIVVTPGMVELGDKQYELNKKFGEYISEVADEVILIGKNQTKPIYDGLIENEYKKEHIHILNDVKESFKLIEKLKDKDTYVLLENDLPDIFNERG